MSGTKVVLIGAGSFVFGPGLLSQIFLEEGLDGIELALVDPDGEAAELMAGVGRRMAREQGLKATITSHTDRKGALAGANFVVNSASVQMRRRFAMDREIIHKYIPGHLITEFGGFHFDTVQSPLNAFDATYRSFQQYVLPEVNKRGMAGIGMKSLGAQASSCSKVQLRWMRLCGTR